MNLQIQLPTNLQQSDILLPNLVDNPMESVVMKRSIKQPSAQQSVHNSEIKLADSIVLKKQSSKTDSVIISIQPPQQQQNTQDRSLQDYFKIIYQKLDNQNLLEDKQALAQYHQVFQAKIQRNTSNQVELITKMLDLSYIKFLNLPLNLSLIKIFIEENIDFFAQRQSMSRFNDNKAMSFVIMLKYMRMYNANGQVLYESMLAYLYNRLISLFEQVPFNKSMKYLNYFESKAFWNNRPIAIDQELQDEAFIITIIRKLSLIFWGMLWIDSNYVINYKLEEFQPISKYCYEYTFLEKDRKYFHILINQFKRNCRSYVAIPALSSLFDILSNGVYNNEQKELNILKDISLTFNDFIDNFKIDKVNLNELGKNMDNALKELFEKKLVRDEGLVQIVKSKMSLQRQDHLDFYFLLFQISADYKDTFYT